MSAAIKNEWFKRSVLMFSSVFLPASMFVSRSGFVYLGTVSRNQIQCGTDTAGKVTHMDFSCGLDNGHGNRFYSNVIQASNNRYF